MDGICAFTAICQEDVHRWGDQYIAEAERWQLPFVMHFDRCSPGTVARLTGHPLCVGTTEQPDRGIPFNETHKQAALDLVRARGFRWALALDADETLADDAPAKLADVAERCRADYVLCRWVNLWGDVAHVRVDGRFAYDVRPKLFSLRSGFVWRYNSPVLNSPTGYHTSGEAAILRALRPYTGTQRARLERQLRAQATGGPEPAALVRDDIIFVHHGLISRELRELHKRRWDSIYGKAVGYNPYQIWDYALDEVTYPPAVEPLAAALTTEGV